MRTNTASDLFLGGIDVELQDIYDLLETHLGNCTGYAPEKMGKLKRVRLPIPAEYGGGTVTGYGYEETVRNLIDKIRDQIKKEAKGPLFRDCWDKWIELKIGQRKAGSTVGNYKWVAKTYLLPFFEEKRIDEITSDDIQEYFNGIMDLSKSVSVQSKAILSGIFDRAVRLGDIQKNLMLYKYERSRKTGKKVVLQDEELIQVMEQTEKVLETGDVRDYLYFCFLCFTALRRGEILGLRWKDIDFYKCEISVSNNVTFPNGQNDSIVGAPKDDSYGIVYLHTELARKIKPYAKEGWRYILPYGDDEPKKPMTRSMFNKMWSRITRKVDVKGATSHSFRASYATMMNTHCEHIDPKALQGALRHKTPDLAIKVYTKENENKTRKAEKEYDEYLCSTLSHDTVHGKVG